MSRFQNLHLLETNSGLRLVSASVPMLSRLRLEYERKWVAAGNRLEDSVFRYKPARIESAVEVALSVGLPASALLLKRNEKD